MHTACVAACQTRCAVCDEEHGKLCSQCDYSANYYNTTDQLIYFFANDFDAHDLEIQRQANREDKESDSCRGIPAGVSIDAEGGIFLKPKYSVVVGNDTVGKVILSCVIEPGGYATSVATPMAAC